MIQKILSKKVNLPTIFLVETDEDLKTLPKGIPYIIGKKEELMFITLFLEFQVLLKSCYQTRIPIKWEDCLKKLGYTNKIRIYELSSGGEYLSGEGVERPTISIDDFIEDQYLVNFDRLSELKILPKWLDDLKSAIETNIINEVMFDPSLYNKPTGMYIGNSCIKYNLKNLLILDVSGSMPRNVVKTITLLAKLMSKKFYADIMITSGQTILIDYEQVQESDIEDLARKSGNGNEGIMYRGIVKEFKEYNTVISFGDDDSPGRFDSSTTSEICNFKVETLYSLHTNGKKTNNITGYAQWFKPKTTHIVKDWINTIN